MVGKKGYVRTLEVLIAVVLTLVFLLVLIPRVGPDERQTVGEGVLSRLEQRDDFRECAIARNATCIEDMVDNQLPVRYKYEVRISDSPNELVEIDVDSDVFSESVFLAGDDTQYNVTIVRLLYWK